MQIVKSTLHWAGTIAFFLSGAAIVVVDQLFLHGTIIHALVQMAHP